jgi:UDP-N-acetyl-D-mannosaminuronic acid dehydrogenase
MVSLYISKEGTEINMDHVCVAGLGYVGLPMSIALAAHGTPVTGIDTNKELIKTLQNGSLSFKEKGLEQLFHKALENNIKFTDEYARSDIYIIAVPTPYDKISKKIDPCYVIAAFQSVMDVCGKGAIVVVESTISPGTIDRYIRPAIKSKGLEVGRDIHIAHAPERIFPGDTINELINNDRVIGADDPAIGEKVKSVYAAFSKGNIVLTDIRTAELAKIVENTYRDINIAFANELCQICRMDNLDVYEIIKIANMHPRVNILNPGPGVGGHCVSVDPWFLVGDYPNVSHLIHEARNINDSMPEYVLGRIQQIMRENEMTDYSRIGFYGLTYKEDVDDTRDSPTLQLFDRIKLHLGMPPKVYDPMVTRAITPNQYDDFDKFLESADLIVLMVGHSHIIGNMDRLKGKIVYDTRNICNLPGCYKL